MEKINKKEIESFSVINETQIHINIKNVGTKLFILEDTDIDGNTFKNIDELIIILKTK